MLRFCVLLFIAGSAAAQGFNCPDDGFFMDTIQCDKYFDCYRGQATEKLCPDGLMFDSAQAPRVGQCTYPFLVECPQDYIVQPAQPSGVCPRQNGLYEHEDPAVCDKYYECTNGIAKMYKCHSGLVFDEFTGTCVWETSGLRTGCTKEVAVLKDGFSCPDITQVAVNGHETFHEVYPNPSDCRSFYICFGGEEPNEGGCPEGQVFNDLTLVCDDPANVSGCENYYGAVNDI